MAYAWDAGYALWMKSDYPISYFKASLDENIGKKDDTKNLLSELDYFGIKIENPVLESADIVYTHKGNVLYRPINSLNGIGTGVTSRIVEMSKMEFKYFTDILIHIKEDTTFKLNRTQMSNLILIGFFRKYGSEIKLLKLQKEFLDGKNKYASSSKFEDKKIAALKKKREALIEFETTTEEKWLPKLLSIRYQLEILGMSYDTDEEIDEDLYLVAKVDGDSTRKIYLYHVKTGEEIMLKYSAGLYRERPIEEFKLIKVLAKQTKPLQYMVNGKFETDNTRFSDWLLKFSDYNCGINF